MESKTDRTLERIAKALESIAKDFHKVTAPARGVTREAKPGFSEGGYVGGEHIGVPISLAKGGHGSWPPPYGGEHSVDLLDSTLPSRAEVAQAIFGRRAPSGSSGVSR